MRGRSTSARGMSSYRGRMGRWPPRAGGWTPISVARGPRRRSCGWPRRGRSSGRAVWELLLEIPYGETSTYGALADELSARRGARCPARAVGGAVGHNPISIVIPCHRVLGAGGSLTGYAGGVERKSWLLRHEASPA